MDGSLWTWILDFRLRKRFGGQIGHWFSKDSDLVLLTDLDNDFRGIWIVFLRIPPSLFAAIPLVMAVKLRRANWIFGFQGFGYLRFFRIRILHVWILDLATNILIGSGLFGASISKILRLRLSVFTVSDRLLLRCFLIQRCTRNTPCSKHFSPEVAALTGKLIMR